MHNNHKLTYLRLQAPEPLFSHADDYGGALQVIGAQEVPAIAFALFEQQIHLLLKACPAEAEHYLGQLLKAFTGDAQHPLQQYCQFTGLAPSQLVERVLHLHSLPAQHRAAPDIYPWTSHRHYTGEQHHSWLATADFWQQVCPRRQGRSRAYRHLMNRKIGVRADTAPAVNNPANNAPARARVRVVQCDYQVADVVARVLADFHCSRAQLGHARMRRRAIQLAGVAAALCEILHLDTNESLAEIFGVSEAALPGFGKAAYRLHTQYLVHTASQLKSARAPLPAPATSAAALAVATTPFQLETFLGQVAKQPLLSPPLTEQ